MNPPEQERRTKPRTPKDEIVTRLLLKLAMLQKIVQDDQDVRLPATGTDGLRG
jgi:hypothetical protein